MHKESAHLSKLRNHHHHHLATEGGKCGITCLRCGAFFLLRRLPSLSLFLSSVSLSPVLAFFLCVCRRVSAFSLHTMLFSLPDSLYDAKLNSARKRVAKRTALMSNKNEN